MGYKIILAPAAEKELDNAPADVQRKVIAVFDVLAENPLMGKKLKGEYVGMYSVRAWPYRIMYRIFKKELLVSIVRIQHRKDAYR